MTARKTDLRLATSILAYLLAFLALTNGLAERVHSAVSFFSPVGSLVFGLVFALVVAALTALFRWLEGRPVGAGLVPGRGKAPAFALGATLGALAYVLVVLIQWALGYVVFGGMQADSALSMFLASLARNPGLGFGEELAFRGHILSRLCDRAGFRFAALVSSLLYAGCHYAVWGFGAAAFVGLTLLGLVLAGLVRRTGALWASIGFHAAWNITQGGVFGLSMLQAGRGRGLLALEQRGPEALVGAGFLTEGGLTTMAVLAATAVFALWPPRKGPIPLSTSV
ncbi:MAG TPA: type II CAAX endopeptidase family protein [Vicinamibacteria bacterium]